MKPYEPPKFFTAENCVITNDMERDEDPVVLKTAKTLARLLSYDFEIGPWEELNENDRHCVLKIVEGLGGRARFADKTQEPG